LKVILNKLHSDKNKSSEKQQSPENITKNGEIANKTLNDTTLIVDNVTELSLNIPTNGVGSLLDESNLANDKTDLQHSLKVNTIHFIKKKLMIILLVV
jgi:hypothetical protein